MFPLYNLETEYNPNSNLNILFVILLPNDKRIQIWIYVLGKWFLWPSRWQLVRVFPWNFHSVDSETRELLTSSIYSHFLLIVLVSLYCSSPSLINQAHSRNKFNRNQRKPILWAKNTTIFYLVRYMKNLVKYNSLYRSLAQLWN